MRHVWNRRRPRVRPWVLCAVCRSLLAVGAPFGLCVPHERMRGAR